MNSDDKITTNGRRLDRIEDKIDKLSQMVISLARAEEKLIALEANREHMNERLVRAGNRINDLENKLDETNFTVRIINRLFWILVSVGSAAWLSQFFVQG